MKQLSQWMLVAILSLRATAAVAQTSLASRVYHNANIMQDALADATKDIDKQMAEARQKAIAELEKKKGRPATETELADIDKQMVEGRKMLEAMKKGMKVGITMTFKSDRELAMKCDMKMDDEVLKAAGISWAKRKALKLALAVAPSTQKGTYVVKDRLVIVDDGEDKDTLRLNADGSQLTGMFDKQTKFTLTRTK